MADGLAGLIKAGRDLVRSAEWGASSVWSIRLQGEDPELIRSSIDTQHPVPSVACAGGSLLLSRIIESHTVRSRAILFTELHRRVERLLPDASLGLTMSSHPNRMKLDFIWTWGNRSLLFYGLSPRFPAWPDREDRQQSSTWSAPAVPSDRLNRPFRGRPTAVPSFALRDLDGCYRLYHSL